MKLYGLIAGYRTQNSMAELGTLEKCLATMQEYDPRYVSLRIYKMVDTGFCSTNRVKTQGDHVRSLARGRKSTFGALASVECLLGTAS
jgi:hypothetical protein